ncbi:MAG TPA: N-acetylglucosamine-6-phosphate deacetylase [bacterium]|mgnify:CR=1 FL=1|nr:N-acetylglucosamine-6-phosphate deacetylase [bacterium]HOL48073.1 N-acetylglucosamine-6-phosphate deacetylase [bacterium]HPQ19094.1 N-acetylglucosamine-6-phosphate deacetylase [bacterium]
MKNKGIILYSKNIFNYNEKLKEKYLIIKNSKIFTITNEIKSYRDYQFLDLENLFLIPGFIDIHTHGRIGIDFLDLSINKINLLVENYLKNGTLLLAPTFISQPSEKIKEIVEFYDKYLNESEYGGQIKCLHFETSYISKKATGAQPEENIKDFNYKEFLFWTKIVKNKKIRIRLTIAPEIKGIKSYLSKLVSQNFLLSIGHTNCNYEEARCAIKNGVSSLTHLFNAMPALHHRLPGPIAAAFENNIFVELIADGIHIEPVILKMVYKLFSEKIILISDSLSAAGLINGTYKIGNKNYIMKKGICKLENGKLAGSSINILDAFKNFYKFTNCSIFDVIRYTSYNPACLLKIEKEYGQIKKNYYANIIGLTKNFDLKFVMNYGKIILNKIIDKKDKSNI